MNKAMPASPPDAKQVSEFQNLKNCLSRRVLFLYSKLWQIARRDRQANEVVHC